MEEAEIGRLTLSDKPRFDQEVRELNLVPILNSAETRGPALSDKLGRRHVIYVCGEVWNLVV